MENWKEINRHTQTNPNLQPCALSTVVFDNSEELLWSGNDIGVVTSYYSDELRKYTSFRAHQELVQQILPIDRGIISISANSIKMTHRRGIPKWSIDEKIEGLQAIIQVPLSPANFLAGGYKKKLYSINAERGQIVDENWIFPSLLCDLVGASTAVQRMEESFFLTPKASS